MQNHKMIDNWGNAKIALPLQFWAYKFSIHLITCAPVIWNIIHNIQNIVAYDHVRDLAEETEATVNKYVNGVSITSAVFFLIAYIRQPSSWREK